MPQPPERKSLGRLQVPGFVGTLAKRKIHVHHERHAYEILKDRICFKGVLMIRKIVTLECERLLMYFIFYHSINNCESCLWGVDRGASLAEK